MSELIAMKRILHVTDCMNAGTKEAILSIVASNSTATHFLLWGSRKDAPGPNDSDFTKFMGGNREWLGLGVIGKARALSRYTETVNPDIVHLHSSRAGIIGRSFLWRRELYYTSHGFGFQRNDIGPIRQHLLLSIEKILSRRKFTYVAIWPVELELARNKLRIRQVKFAPLRELLQIVFEYETLSQAKTANGKGVSIIGRVTPAKDPKFAIEVQKHLLSLCGSRIQWIGAFGQTKKDSDNPFRHSQIVVIPWLPRRELNAIIAQSSVILITSSWEAGPLVFFEALARKIPIVARPIAAFECLGITTFDTPSEFAREVCELVYDEKRRNSTYHQQLNSVRNYMLGESFHEEIYS